MTPSDTILAEYVRVALDLQVFTLSDAQRDAVTRQFMLLAAMAALFVTEPLPADAEPAPIFRL